MNTVRLLTVSVKRQFLEWLGWRAFLLSMVVNQAVTPLLGLAVWSVALPGQAAISGYYVALLAVQLMTVSYEQHTFSNAIYEGKLSHELLKPQPVVLGPLSANIAARSLHLVLGLPLILIAGKVMKVTFEPRLLLLAVPAVLLASVLRFLFTYLLALSAFWSEQAHGIVGFGEVLIFLLGGSAAPIALFPENLRPLGEALPFRGMLGFSAEIASGGLNGLDRILSGYGWQLFWIGVCALLVRLCWRSGIRRFTAIGG